MNVNLNGFIESNSIPYTISRKDGISGFVSGKPVFNAEYFETNMFCNHDTKNIDWGALQTGIKDNIDVKVRISNKYTQLKVGDMFEFEDRTYKIKQQIPYQSMSGIIDFRTYRAVVSDDEVAL